MYPKTLYEGRPRRINVFEYAVFYEPESDGSIFILRVIHGKRDVAQLMQKP
jgi:plasmid stabilization system protein ParE